MKKEKMAHLLLLIIGGMFLLSAAFQNNLWFDETYSVALVRQPFTQMFTYGLADVHPMLYYFLLKIYSIFAGTSIIALRIFSVIGAQLLAMLGYTHIRKDFGNKTGFWFSFMIFATATIFRYAAEIRMYTWLPLFVTLSAIYAYRFFKKTKEKTFPVKEMVLLSIFGLCAAYTHYFGLIAVCVINAMLFIALFIKKHKKPAFIITSAVQILLYIPGIYFLFKQMQTVNKGFWIHIQYPDVIWETLSFFFLGDTPDQSAAFTTTDTVKTCFFILSAILFICCIVRLIQKRATAAILSLSVFFAVTAIALIASQILPTQIYYVRYSLACAGLFAFAFAVAISEFQLRFIKPVFALLLICLTVFRAVPFYQTVYSAENNVPEKYLKSRYNQQDVILTNSMDIASVLAVKNPDLKIYYCTRGKEYTLSDAYKIYQPTITFIDTPDQLPEVSGNILIADGWGEDLSQTQIPGYVSTEKVTFKTPYHTLHYTFSLLIKN